MLAFLLACFAPTTAPASPVSTAPTYYHDVRPVLDRTCARCHTTEGIAPVSFEDPATVVALAGAIRARTQDGSMPPPAPDPACRDYKGADELFLAEADRQLLADWADAGAPLGDQADAPGPWLAETTAPFDVELRGDAPYIPQFNETGNDYRCFVLDVENPDAAYVTGFEALIDEPRIVHHVVLWCIGRDTATPTSDDGGAGFACDGFGESDWDFFAGWAPGGRPVTLPEGTGMRVRPSARLVLQMHYYESYEGAALVEDQSGYGLHLTDSVEKEAYVFPLGTYDFTIPAGDADADESAYLPWSDSWGTIQVMGVFPHMHMLATGFDFTVMHADGEEECLVHLPDWDFHNQQAVLFEEPVTIAGGDFATLTCRWDNSANNPEQLQDPPQDVFYGEETGDEMCFGFTYGYAL